MIPHLVHVGFPKTGSTFLQTWFAAHPKIAYSPSGFAGSATIWDFARDAAGAGLIRCRVTSAEDLSTPIDRGSDIYGSSLPTEVANGQENACRALAEIFPSAYILIVTRGFEAILKSGYSQFVRTGARFSFDAMLSSIGENPASLEYLNYDRFIAMYREKFGDRVIVLPYELLREDRDGFLSRITDALSIGRCVFAPRQINPSLTHAELEWYHRISNTIATLPIPRVRRLLMGRHLGWINNGRWRPLLPYLDRWFQRSPATMIVPDAVLAPLRNYATALVREPLYRPYASAYLG